MGIKPRTLGLCSQCSATELRQLDNHAQAPTILYMYCTGGTEMPQSHTRQPLSMCRQNSIRGQPENSLHQERTHAECFFFLSLTLASCWNKENLDSSTYRGL